MKCDKAIINRLKRTQGQMNGVLNMILEESSCEEIVTQLKAIKSSIEKTIALITTTNLIQNIEKTHNIKLDDNDKSIDLIIKSI